MIFLFPGIGIAGLTIIGGEGTRKRMLRFVALGILAVGVTCLASCGAATGSGTALNAPNGIFNIALNGDSGAQHTSTTLTLVIQR